MHKDTLLNDTNLDPSIVSILKKAEIITVQDILDNPSVIADLPTFKYLLLKNWMEKMKINNL